jgi:hypothetical protein
MTNAYLSHLTGPSGETWQQAMDRFAALCLSLHAYEEDGEIQEVFFDEFFRDGTLFEWLDPVSDEVLNHTEKTLKRSIPPSLKTLFKKRFVIFNVYVRFGRYGERRVLEIYGPSKMTSHSCLHPLCSGIAWNFGPHFAQSNLTDEQQDRLNEQYACFGRWSDNDAVCTYLLVDQQGRFGRLLFDSNDDAGNMNRLQPLLAGQTPPLTLDELMVDVINRSMVYLLQRNDIPLAPPIGS